MTLGQAEMVRLFIQGGWLAVGEIDRVEDDGRLRWANTVRLTPTGRRASGAGVA